MKAQNTWFKINGFKISFDENGKLKTWDGAHFTKSGAKWFGKRLKKLMQYNYQLSFEFFFDNKNTLKKLLLLILKLEA